MQIETLRKQVAATLTKTKVLKLTAIAKRKDFSIKELIELTFDADKQIAFRAAWILENLLLTDPAAVLEDLEDILFCFPKVSNPSCQRHYAKILMYLSSSKAIDAIKTKMGAFNLEPVIETCFDWLIDPQVAVAVKVFCCETLFNLRNRYDWIADELIREVEFLMKDGSAALQSKGKKILKQLVQ
ncbi:hypothetical protein [Mucilaginibacter arboris]|uniref:HEAT repeat domain-containing protein n=1 Tax=Mucilaginibacter arboris TaxID=2682090 RepID=A0A7K1SZN2_9SPHI|nr:hypothetical protein [Mucilaginibacter arboris]MVN22717.1 hypothetical protein [Mucilaginibacter arboris]